MNHQPKLVTTRQLITDPLYEHYNNNTDNFSVNCYADFWIAQTFTPSQAHIIKKVCLKAFHYGIIAQVATIGIQATDNDGKPTGPDLTFTTFTTHLFKRDSPAEWQCIDLPGYELTAGVSYAIVLRVPGAGVGDRLVPRVNTAGTYPNGTAVDSPDGGVTWTVKAPWDFQFEEWGVPPVPPPPPGPPSKWACLSIQATCLADGYTFVSTTNKPVHLWLRLTDHPTRKHLSSEIVRGETKMTNLKFCFTVYADIEQQEAGDTLEHTFIVRNWLNLPFNEQWGTSLSENNPWVPYAPPDIPLIEFQAGILKVTNPGIVDCGMYTIIPSGLLPLLKDTEAHLFFNTYNLQATANSTSSSISHELWFMKDTDIMVLYLNISHGEEFDDEHWGYVGGNPYGWQTIGIGAKTVNLTEMFTYFRGKLGLSTDPTGWGLYVNALALGTYSPSCTDYLRNDYITINHGIPPDNTVYPAGLKETRYFYFIGTIDEQPSPSTSNIFTYRFPPHPYRNQLTDTPDASDRAYSDQAVFSIFYPPRDYYCARLAALLSKESVDDPPEYPDYIYLEVREAPNLNPCGTLVALATIPTWRVPVDPLYRWEWDTVRGVSLKKGQPYALIVKSSSPFGSTNWGMTARGNTNECIMSPTLAQTLTPVTPCPVADQASNLLFFCGPESATPPKGEHYI